MFNQYYDTIEYKKQLGKDKFGGITYSQAESKSVRFVKGADTINLDGEKMVTRYKRTYHTPFEVKEGDMIDNHLVTDVKPARDLNGTIHFWIVGVI